MLACYFQKFFVNIDVGLLFSKLFREHRCWLAIFKTVSWTSMCRGKKWPLKTNVLETVLNENVQKTPGSSISNFQSSNRFLLRFGFCWDWKQLKCLFLWYVFLFKLFTISLMRSLDPKRMKMVQTQLVCNSLIVKIHQLFFRQLEEK